MSARSRSDRTALAGRCLVAALVILVGGLTAAPPPMLPVAGADPPRLAMAERRSLAWSHRSGHSAWSAGSGGLASTIDAPGRVPPLRPPVSGPVVRGFEPSSGPYGPGHRGLDLAAALGAAVGAPAAGRVVFAGQVAGLRWVSVEVAAGVVVTVGPLDRPVVAASQQVVTRSQLGRLAAGHPGGLHLGLRVDGVYVDPLPYLVGAGPPRLAPLPLRPGTAAPTRRDGNGSRSPGPATALGGSGVMEERSAVGPRPWERGVR